MAKELVTDELWEIVEPLPAVPPSPAADAPASTTRRLTAVSCSCQKRARGDQLGCKHPRPRGPGGGRGCRRTDQGAAQAPQEAAPRQGLRLPLTSRGYKEEEHNLAGRPRVARRSIESGEMLLAARTRRGRDKRETAAALLNRAQDLVRRVEEALRGCPRFQRRSVLSIYEQLTRARPHPDLGRNH